MINITNKGQKAVELFHGGYNCAQAVAGAFADEMGFPLETVLKLAQPFGGGIGRLREVCGAFSGAVLVIGQLYGDDAPNSPNKMEVYKIVQHLAERFREERGSLVCREILEAMKNDKDQPADAPKGGHNPGCANMCALSASILEEYIREHGR